MRLSLINGMARLCRNCCELQARRTFRHRQDNPLETAALAGKNPSVNRFDFRRTNPHICHPAAGGGDEFGANLRSQNYGVNNLNQYTNRTVPGYVDLQGMGATNATVTVNNQATYQKGEFFRGREIPASVTTRIYDA